MNTALQSLIEQQRQRLNALREDTDDMAAAVADRVWDDFEVQVEDATREGFMFDFANATSLALTSSLALSFQEAVEARVLSVFENMENELNAQLEQDQIAYPSARADLSALRKGLKLHGEASEWIEEAIERAKPGFIRMLFATRDITSDAWDEEMREDARRVRRELLALQPKILAEVRAKVQSLIRAARLAHGEWLDELAAHNTSFAA